MLFSDIAAQIEGEQTGGDAEILSVEYDSRRVKPGSLFCCLVGLVSDGHRFAEKAVQSGAVALIVQQRLPLDVPQLVCRDSRKAAALAAAAFYKHPEREMTMLAVTGTNGKTSTTYMVKSVAEHAGLTGGLVGTIHNAVGNTVFETGRTTPESVDLYALLRRMRDSGATLVVMEVSSHALVQERVAGIRFKAGLFTNLTQDHLDYHKTFDNYLEAKKRLFGVSDLAIINMDDPYAERMAAGLTCPVQSMSLYQNADFRADEIVIRPEGASFTLYTPKGSARISLHISGLFSVYNAMSAAALCMAAGLELPDIAAGLCRLSGVSGRLERVNTGSHPFSVYVDYAHTPDALMNVLKTCEGFRTNRIISVFGCGGDRDRTKRPIMGRIGGEHSDFVVVTSDNPRTEDPQSIVDEIEPGVKATGTPYVCITDRRQGIAYALEHAESGDIIVVAGKGHEDYQEINGVHTHFDDREVVRELLGEIKPQGEAKV
ncbi:MAG TPA: UDP-N-acetylmuramoyl-L-alanyl-D-glutamate--2,6-diaminopimelate ligase [Eubacteriales bacterium]|nr:UDP-N-acetylmuramoyl-L-alanyl-D-glutamate--2,6-diaminopimelate ligase [Eubacteriales bacterium]